MRRLCLNALIGLFLIGCAGASSLKSQLLNSLGEVLPEEQSDEEIAEQIKENTETTPPPPPDDPDDNNKFPYDLQIDTIAYLPSQTKSHPHFIAGAFFSRSGLRLSEHYLRAGEDMSNSDLEAYIKTSTKHLAMPFFGVHMKNNLRTELAPKKGFNGVIRLYRLIKDLVESKANRIREFENDSIAVSWTSTKSSTDTPPYPGSIYAECFKPGGQHIWCNNFQWVFALTYAKDTNKDTPLYHKTDAEVGVDIYGRVYEAEFLRAKNGNNSAFVLSSISEQKLPDKVPQNDWVCPDFFRLEVRRHSQNAYTEKKFYDWNSAHTPNYKKNYPTIEEAKNAEDEKLRPLASELLCADSASQDTKYQVVRKILGDQWNINISDKCISPKSAEQRLAFYRATQQNYPSRFAFGEDDCLTQGDNFATKLCPEYFSLCLRKN